MGPGELDEMEKTQSASDKTFVFRKTEYKTRKVVWILGEVEGRKVKIRTEVVEWAMVESAREVCCSVRKKGVERTQRVCGGTMWLIQGEDEVIWKE